MAGRKEDCRQNYRTDYTTLCDDREACDREKYGLNDFALHLCVLGSALGDQVHLLAQVDKDPLLLDEVFLLVETLNQGATDICDVCRDVMSF